MHDLKLSQSKKAAKTINNGITRHQNVRRSKSLENTGHRLLPPIYEQCGEHTAGRPFKQKRPLMCKCNTSWTLVQIATLTPIPFNAQQQKSFQALASPKLPSAFVDGEASMMPPGVDIPEAPFPTGPAPKKVDACHSSQARATRMSTKMSHFHQRQRRLPCA